MRGLGYSPETALADLLDNSIAAGASQIEIDIDWNGGEPRVEILDDGAGLTFEALKAAMRFGGGGPQADRASDDLGRFGLGLKTASLSQCRRLTVAARRDGVTSCIAWDVDEVDRARKWEAQLPPAPSASAFSSRLASLDHGALVVWERMDAIGGFFGLDKAAFFARIVDIRAHFGMVFHRFLSGDARRIGIAVNGRTVKGWDPFQRQHPATIALAPERRRLDGGSILISRYVLPHRDRFANDATYAEAGGIGGWSERQGFYVYRGQRLVVAGGWLGLGRTRAWTREEASRLARIGIDLPTSMDAAWRIDIRKSLARPPSAIRERLTDLAESCREKAREVFAWRGGGTRRQTIEPAAALWTADYVNRRARYRINRRHPAVIRLAEAVGTDSKILSAALALIERTVPVEQVWLDISENTEPIPEMSHEEIAELAPELASLIAAFRDESTTAERLDRLLRPLRIDSPQLRTSVLKLLEPPE
jgi:hypothetical protein